MTCDNSGPSLHPIKRLLEKLEVARAVRLLAAAIDPLLLQRILSRPIGLIEDTEDTREGQRCQLISS